VPASLVMVANGALFGIASGALLSLAGSLTAAVLGFALGRWGRASLHRFVSPEEGQQADALVRRWGGLAVLVTRPVPIAAESVAILAGVSPMGWRRFLLAALAGNLPPSALYAIAGSTATRVDNMALMLFMMFVAALVWFVGQRLYLLTLVPRRER
ncbi:MAG: VTT domain-containing protein, partial [bacterium]|nr:VTT domain-containing protein [bacterium]